MPKPRPIHDVQLPNETSVAFEAYCAYRDMGPSRSADAVAKRLGKSTAHMRRWSSQHRWMERVIRYDGYLDGIRMAQAEQAAEQSGAKLARQRERERDRKLSQSQRISRRVEEMLSHPIVEQTIQSVDGRTTIIIQPVRWHAGHIATLALAAARLAASALDQPTDRVSVELDLSAEAARLAEELGLPIEDVVRLIPDITRELGEGSA